MIFTIRWAPPALFVFYRLPFHTAALVDRSVIRLVERGEGRVEWVAPYHRLWAGKYEVALSIDREALTVTVVSIYRSRS